MAQIAHNVKKYTEYIQEKIKKKIKSIVAFYIWYKKQFSTQI